MSRRAIVRASTLPELEERAWPAARHTILCISSYFKGNRFLQAPSGKGRGVFLLTVESLRGAAWDRDSLDDLFVMPSWANCGTVINGVAYLMRKEKIDRIVALDDYDVELGAALREHFRLPGWPERQPLLPRQAGDADSRPRMRVRRTRSSCRCGITRTCAASWTPCRRRG